MFDVLILAMDEFIVKRLRVESTVVEKRDHANISSFSSGSLTSIMNINKMNKLKSNTKWYEMR